MYGQRLTDDEVELLRFKAKEAFGNLSVLILNLVWDVQLCLMTIGVFVALILKTVLIQ